MITLFSNDCAKCRQVKAALEAHRRQFKTTYVDEEVARMLFERGHREMPVLTDGVIEVSGHDCIVSLQEGEI